MLNKQAVIKIAKELDFPKEQYLVITGTVLAAHEIREADDVDIVVNQELFDELKEDGGWKFTN